MSLSPALSTYAAIEQKVRHLTNSPDNNSLTSSYIQQTLNDIYNNDFAYGVKIDQQRSVYEFYTQKNIDTYPLDVNYNQGVRSPVLFDGIKGQFFKDRTQFYNVWPKISTQFQPISGNGATQEFDFTVAGPFLRNEVMLGGTDVSGDAITCRDGGDGRMYYITSNAVTYTPSINSSSPVPGMPNANLGNPGLITSTDIGSVDYVTGEFDLDFTPAGVTPADGEQMILRVSQYQTGKPYSLLFWNNEFVVRPVPDAIHKIEVEVYLTPVQFLQSTNHPILNQWWKYLAYLVSAEIQRERNDFDSVAQLQEGAKRQESLVLERQGVEEIGQMTPTLFNSPTPYPYLNNNYGMGWL